MIKKCTLIFVAILYTTICEAQKKLIISGYVQDAKSNEKMVGVSVWAPYLKKGTTTNNHGYFALTFVKDTATVYITATGYVQKEYFFNLANADSILQINLTKAPITYDGVTVIARKKVPIEERTNMGQVSVPVETIKALPRFLGEADVLKTIQLLPGVQQGAEGTSGILVRGGGPEQNLILLDGTPVYNTQHLFGIFSTFNADVIKNVELYKGGFPARFGGRLSSVVDIVTKDGNMQQWKGEAGIGLIMSRFTIEGPLKKGKTSLLLGGRRSYLDIIAQPFVKAAAKKDGADVGFGAYLYDINVKLNHIISKKDRVFLSLFSGQDFLRFRLEEKDRQGVNNQKLRFGYGNVIGSARWNHIVNKQLFCNTIVSYTNYRFVTNIQLTERSGSNTNTFTAKYYSGITDVAASTNFDYRPSAKHAIKFGGGIINHRFSPGATTFKTANNNIPDLDTAFNTKPQNGIEADLYIEDDWEITNKLKANIGVHGNLFQTANKTYPTLQPRIGLRYLLPSNWALKAAYTQMAQTIHLLTNSTTTLPTDLWVPSTDKIRPMKSTQYAIGVAKTISNGKIEISAEAYYKDMNGIIEYKDGANFLNSSVDSWDTKIEQGKGVSQGIELLIQKQVGKTTGWIGYTLSKSNRQFENINFGKTFFYKYDRRHDFEVVVTHKISKRLEVSGSWGFATANPISLPTTNYQVATFGSPYMPNYNFLSSNTVDYYNGRNGFRLLNYHRLDASINWIKQKKRFTRTWNLSLYNAYNRKNPFFYYLDYDNVTSEGNVVGITILPIIPNLSWSISF